MAQTHSTKLTPSPGVFENLKIQHPVHVDFKPKADITAFELASLLPFLTRGWPIMPWHLPKEECLRRHLVIFDPNKDEEAKQTTPGV
jgi:hypothetical protein